MLFVVNLCRYTLWVSFKEYLIELVELLWEEEQWKRCDVMFNRFKNWLVAG